ncbi:hypothetical protein FQN60_001565 [Etheostoma spectabile]|uniref:Uncharacterized protein n=1 Tax=Etheostoma spectabile TaxID=54343 RepID=A0A5J5D9V1_9PERO|nr:hypothetical protein FQN60_001565 [Etheostoma spectabile]
MAIGRAQQRAASGLHGESELGNGFTEHCYICREPTDFRHIWTKEGMSRLGRGVGHGQQVGRDKGLATCIQRHLEPLTDVRTTASGEVFLLTDRSVATIFLDNNNTVQV